MNSTTIKNEARSVCIAEQNDKFRKHVIDFFGAPPTVIPGMMVKTQSVADMNIVNLAQLLAEIVTYDAFSEESDTYGEHDFGSVEIDGDTFFWKIDYYADDSLTYGSEDPADPAKTYRVLTVMLASEY